MTAHPDRSRKRIEGLGARVTFGDVLDATSLDHAVEGADSVIQVLTFPTYPAEKPRKRFTFEEFEHHGTERLVNAAAKAGARKYVYCSGTGVAPDAPKVWFRAKWFGEEAIRATAIPHSIIRPSWVFGPEDPSLNKIVAFHRWLPFIPVIGDGNQRLQPVFVDDIAEVMAQAADPAGPAGTYEIGGPQVMTMNEVLRTMMEVRGRIKPLIHFPVFLPKLAGFFLQVLPTPPLSPEAVDIAAAEAVADTEALLREFDLRLTPLREGLATYLAR